MKSSRNGFIEIHETIAIFDEKFFDKSKVVLVIATVDGRGRCNEGQAFSCQ